LPGYVDFRMRIVLEAATFFAIPGVLFFALWAMYPHDFRPLRLGRWQEAKGPARPAEGTRPAAGVLRTFNTAVGGLAVAGSLAFVLVATLVPTRVVSDLIYVYRLLSLVFIAGGSAVLVQITMRGREMAWGAVVGYGVLVLAG